MIQIMALRPYEDKAGKKRKTHRIISEKWQAESVAELFKNYPKYLKSIPEKERWNIYYTALDCKGDDKKKLPIPDAKYRRVALWGRVQVNQYTDEGKGEVYRKDDADKGQDKIDNIQGCFLSGCVLVFEEIH